MVIGDISPYCTFTIWGEQNTADPDTSPATHRSGTSSTCPYPLLVLPVRPARSTQPYCNVRASRSLFCDRGRVSRAGIRTFGPRGEVFEAGALDRTFELRRKLGSWVRVCVDTTINFRIRCMWQDNVTFEDCVAGKFEVVYILSYTRKVYLWGFALRVRKLIAALNRC
jgi:hypothetical protein